MFYLPRVADSSSSASDQSTQAASWWQSPADLGAVDNNANFFSSTHGLVQTHPLVGPGPAVGPAVGSAGALPGLDPLASLNVVRKGPGAPAPPQPPRKIDAPKKALIELERNPSLSSPEECARACREGEPPRTCYYHFTVELYTVLGA